MGYSDEIGYDEIGYDEIGEDSLFEDVGAASPRRGQPRQGQVKKRAMGSHEWLGLVGFLGTSIAAAAAPAVFTVAVTCNFTLRQMVMDRVQAASLTVGELKIGQTSIFGSNTTSPCPGDVFAPDSLVNPVFRNLPTVSPAVGFQIWLGNAGGAAVVPRIGFIGVCSQAVG